MVMKGLCVNTHWTSRSDFLISGEYMLVHDISIILIL